MGIRRNFIRGGPNVINSKITKCIKLILRKYLKVKIVSNAAAECVELERNQKLNLIVQNISENILTKCIGVLMSLGWRGNAS